MSLLKDITDHLELEPDQLMSYIDEFESIQPYDCMIDTARAVVSFSAGNFERAEKYILQALKKNPGNYINHFCRALTAKALGRYETAALECLVTFSFATQFGTSDEIKDVLNRVNHILGEIGPKLSREETERFAVWRNILTTPGSFFPAYYLYDTQKWSRYIGKFLYFQKQKQYNDYICLSASSYMDGINLTLQQVLLDRDDYNLYAFTPTVSWKAMKTKRFTVPERDSVLAIAATSLNQTITISSFEGKKVQFALNAPNIYHYINMDQPGVLSSAHDFIASKPISISGAKKKKKLILTVFVDAISQWYLTKSNYKYMPYTKEFFGNGMIFKNCFSTSEWTVPSVASLQTGVYTTHHHIIYRSSAYQYPAHIKTAGEIFNDDGYFTALVSGSVGTSPYVGGLRGFDCSTLKSCAGFPDSYLVEDALNYMDSFSHTDQFVSVGLFRPHTVTDGSAESTLNTSMLEQTALSFRDVYASTESQDKKSAWKQYSRPAVRKYQIALIETDRQLKKLYDYVISHYAEDEYVFCLYSDHGVGIVSEEDHLLKKPRTNSVLMLRGGGIPAGISEEYINHIDHLPILTKLAGIDVDFSQQDCVLPRTFGGSGRAYVYTESIYQGQTYKAAVRTDEFECRFESNANTDIDGLIDLSQGYTQKIFSMQTGKEIQDAELAEDFEAIVFDHIKENIKY